MAKELCIHVGEQDIYTGAALRTLSRDCGEECAFPLVRSFRILLESYTVEHSNEWEDSDESKGSDNIYDVYRANVIAFMLWIKHMIPKVREVSVGMSGPFVTVNDRDDHTNDLVTQLYQLGNRVKYICKNGRDLPVEWRLGEIRYLVHISFRAKFDSGQFAHLARQNAQTLQSLYLQSLRLNELADLIQNSGGSYVTYPCLHALNLCEFKFHDIPRRPIFPGAVPFPFLRSLTLRLQYPFGDGTLFRGNSTTLESLVLQADSLFVAMARQHGIFMPTTHPRLQCVVFGHLGRLVPDTFATYTEGVRYALSIGPGAAVRRIGVPPGDELLSALSLTGDHTSIQVLSIERTTFDLQQVVSLVKSLPLLSDLHAPLPRIGPKHTGVTMDKFPSYMVSTFAPIGKRFRCWHLENCTDGYRTGDVECMLLLALICPNFDYVSTDKKQRESFMEDLKEYINLSRFSPYVPRLRRLLFNGWQNC
ncbi:hypothetical protein GGI09_000994 [Coemansia sp. S100]|nr:hypothetical protein GGI09_000994 [Coemansia sp. S100]KAJ2347324.1 hypothetical protein GGH92_003243 [Coemansia sp. RSA 2673]